MLKNVPFFVYSKNEWCTFFCIVYILGVGWCSIFWTSLFFPEVTDARVEFYTGQANFFSGKIIDEPDVRISDVHYQIAIDTVTQNKVSHVAEGIILVPYDLYPRFIYGDYVRVRCVLQRPQPIIDKTTGKSFSYPMYLARFHIYSVCEHPRIERIAQDKGNLLYTYILRLKNYIAKKITLLWPEPEASFMAGLLYGYRGGLGELNDAFSITGVTHIVAISGFNISVIASICSAICTRLCVSRKKIFWIVSGMIIIFVIFTGASASVVRAGIMGIITLLARHLGRPSQVNTVLLICASAMLMQNPLILLYDAGFQLSFLSTVGLLYIAPHLENRLHRLPNVFNIKENVCTTLGAIIATMPLIMYQFGRVSLVAPLVNVMILWCIPWIMLLGVLALMASIGYFPLGQLLAWGGWIGMRYVIAIVRSFADIPFASLAVKVPFWLMLIIYCGILILLFFKNKKQYGKKNKSI